MQIVDVPSDAAVVTANSRLQEPYTWVSLTVRCGDGGVRNS